FADFFGPMLLAIMAVTTGSSRNGILALIILFVIAEQLRKMRHISRKNKKSHVHHVKNKKQPD
ncbi:MAG: hypothetical protein KMY54_10220, partial [Erysipelothrix sp.]|nr:hypothetical protein [Erysipelothrix sp.]